MAQMQNTNQLFLKTQVWREGGKWYVNFTAPRWFIDELEHATIRVESSRILAGGTQFDEAGLLISFKPEEKD